MWYIEMSLWCQVHTLPSWSWSLLLWGLVWFFSHVLYAIGINYFNNNSFYQYDWRAARTEARGVEAAHCCRCLPQCSWLQEAEKLKLRPVNKGEWKLNKTHPLCRIFACWAVRFGELSCVCNRFAMWLSVWFLGWSHLHWIQKGVLSKRKYELSILIGLSVS